MTTEEKLYVWTVRIATSRTLVTLPSTAVFNNPRPAGGFSQTALVYRWSPEFVVWSIGGGIERASFISS